MRNIKRALWGIIAIPLLLWLIAEPAVFRSTSYFAVREIMVQASGTVAMACMSVAMVLALRPRWPERWLGGLDKMYRLHKWLGITALVAATIHWLWAQGTKWAVGWGWLERPVRGVRPPIENPVEALFLSVRGVAESLGEWAAFYPAVVLIALALIQSFPYRPFYKTHRLLAVTYLVLVFHAVVLLKYSYWASPLGWLMALLIASGAWAAVVVLLRRVGASRQVGGSVSGLEYFPGVKSLAMAIEVPKGWPGHKPGQFAFVTSDASEGAHPYTIASGWHSARPEITFIVKELGDHTSGLRDQLRTGQEVTLEGPYGCFTFDDDRPLQIWVGGGIGITPFVARMKHMALQKAAPDWPASQQVHLFHTTADVDEEALRRLAADAEGADVRLHVLIDARHGFLNGERIREAVPEWRQASIWFCGPAGFGDALRRDFAVRGFPVEQHFHQELFAMR